MKYFFLILITITVSGFVYAQKPDSSLAVQKDSLKISSKDTTAVQDTTKKKKSFDVDTVIYSSSRDSLFFHVNKKKMDLYGSGELKYKEIDLKSADINIDFVTHDVNAKGVPNDSIPGKFKDTPVLTQGSEAYDGETMVYNFKTGRGFITEAGTKSEGTKYSGDKIKKVDKDTYFVKDGIFTTCAETPPHYYFASSEMKVIQKQEIDAQWIWLYFGGVPFPIPLPFGVFPLQSGRRSGIIPPAFGQDGQLGYYFSHIGYFWAINDYYDVNLTSDYYTRGSYALASRFRYNERYNFSGTLSGGYKVLNYENSQTGLINKDKEWNISLDHQQIFTPTMRATAHLSFFSGKQYLQTTTTDLNQALSNDVYSSATLTKSWDESGNSLSLSYTRHQNLISGDISEVLPSLSFSIPQQYPFRRTGVYNDLKWYELVGVNYNGEFENERNKTADGLNIRGGIEHKVAINASPKFGYINIAPTINYTEDWYNKQTRVYSAGIKADSTADSLITEDVHKLSAVRTFSLGVSASTKFYGMMQPNILGISAIRHIVTPTIGYSFTPDFSEQQWGYYSYYTDHLGRKIKYNKYQNEILSQPGSGQSQSINFSLGNEFDMKTAVDPSDTTDKEKKIQLLNLTASFSYNFAADSVKFSDLVLSYRTNAGDWLSFTGGSSFSLYDWNAAGANINKFLANEGKGLLRLKNFNFSVSTSLSADKFKSAEKKDTTKNNLESEVLNPNQANIYKGIYNQGDPDFSMPWSLSLGYTYYFTKNTPISTSTTSNVNASLDFNLTKQWKFSVAGSYDFIAKEFSAPQIRISRDLECWLMNFTWNPVGTYSGFYFEIRVKAPQLQDLKITKRGDFYNDK